jgi:hypothetical protein
MRSCRRSKDLQDRITKTDAGSSGEPPAGPVSRTPPRQWFQVPEWEPETNGCPHRRRRQSVQGEQRHDRTRGCGRGRGLLETHLPRLAGEISAADFPGHAVRVKLGVEKRRGYPDRNVIEDYAAAPASGVVTPLRAAG